MNRQQSNGNPHPTSGNPTAPLAVPNAHAQPLEPSGRLSAEERQVVGNRLGVANWCWKPFAARWWSRGAGLPPPRTDPLEDTDFAGLARLHRSEAMLVGNLAGKLRVTVRATSERDTRKLPRRSDAWEDGSAHFRRKRHARNMPTGIILPEDECGRYGLD